jgi:predicted XRE-type DNA-binding protein
MTQEQVFEESSGNVFADIGLEDADELFESGKIGIKVIRLLKQRNLKQPEISEILDVTQLEVSHLMKGEFHQFSKDKLLNFLQRLDKSLLIQN